MTAALVLAQLLAIRIGAVAPPAQTVPAAVQGPVQLSASSVLQRYAAALAKVKEPRVLTFDYTLEQTGLRTLAQTHRIYRNASDERDETLTVDGKRLTPPKVRIFRGRRNRYAISTLAPRPADYDFFFVGPRKNAHHFDYVFRLTPRLPRAFMLTDVTIDGVRFLPSEIAFATLASEGSGTITFGRNATWWVPYIATARATIANASAAEKLSFYTYRFPPALPRSTFTKARRPARGLMPIAPAPKPVAAPTSVPAGPPR